MERTEKLDNELVSYYVVNKEVEMSKGKVAAQVAHVATIIALANKDSYEFNKWYFNSQKKIILQGKEKDLLKLIEQGFHYIKDNGLTELPKGTLTCVGLPPMKKEYAKQYVKRMRLLK